MNNQKQIYEALLAGETLINTSMNLMAVISKGGQLMNVDKEGYHVPAVHSFVPCEEWKIYKEPKWYENIPEDGVLCWVWDDDSRSKHLSLISCYITNMYRAAENTCGWGKAKPLTKTEIQIFMDNAPG